jgi:purine-binding chemotaxis protein CheW
MTSGRPTAAATLLRQRAEALARRPPTAASAAAIELLEFRLARDCYALETRHVREVLPLAELAPVPCTPPFVRGVVNVRGRITTVIDLQQFFELPAHGLADLHHVILVRREGLELGLLADAVAGVRTQPLAGLQPPLPGAPGVRPDHLRGVTADRVLVLDLDRMLADPRINVHEEMNP